MATQNLKTRSGNTVIVLIDGKAVGLMKSAEMSDDFSPEPASGIGDIHAIEYVPTFARHTLQCSGVMLRKGSMLEAGVKAENGDMALEGIVFDVSVYDKATGTELRKYRGCTYASGNISVSAHSLIMESATFMALDVEGVFVS